MNMKNCNDVGCELINLSSKITETIRIFKQWRNSFPFDLLFFKK